GVAPTGLSLPDVVHRFKSFTTAEYRNGVKQNNWLPFNGRFWQRNYYEHIIRNEKELDRIRKYIIENPAKWDEDEDNPGNITPAGNIP
ncbi:MAG: transposase, partial [Nitrospirae bacterium]|nr:transposase [Nitrospirota bacterium]